MKFSYWWFLSYIAIYLLLICPVGVYLNYNMIICFCVHKSLLWYRFCESIMASKGPRSKLDHETRTKRQKVLLWHWEVWLHFCLEFIACPRSLTMMRQSFVSNSSPHKSSFFSLPNYQYWPDSSLNEKALGLSVNYPWGAYRFWPFFEHKLAKVGHDICIDIGTVWFADAHPYGRGLYGQHFLVRAFRPFSYPKKKN